MIPFPLPGWTFYVHWLVLLIPGLLGLCLALRLCRATFGGWLSRALLWLPKTTVLDPFLAQLKDARSNALQELFPPSGTPEAQREMAWTWAMMVVAGPVLTLEFYINWFALQVAFPDGHLGAWGALGIVFTSLITSALADREGPDA